MSKITKSAINWAQLEKRVPPDQKSKFFAFKAKSDAYFRRMQTSPPKPPPINWEEYQKLVPVPGLVDKFKSAYSSFTVPYPEDKYSAEVDKQWKVLEQEIAKYCEEMKGHITNAHRNIARVNILPKFEDMTMEMVYETYPELALDPVRKPTFWPHSDDEQLGYRDPMQKIDYSKK